MAVNGIRVSALPKMLADGLTKDDYLIVNDGNTNTRIINYDEFLKSVNTDVSDLDVVTSVNGNQGAVTIGAADVGAPSTSEFIQLEATVQTNNSLTATNTSDLVNLTDRVDTNETDIATNATDIATKANNVPALSSQNFLQQGDTVGECFDKIDVAVTTRAPNVAIKNSKNFITDAMTVGQSVDALDSQLAITANLAVSALQVVPAEYSTTDQANALYAVAGTNGNTVDGNATAIAAIDVSGIATNADAIANLADGSTDLVSPSVNGVAVTATGAELNQLAGVTLGSAASADTGNFATAAQGALADTALQDGSLYATAAQGALADSALQDGSLYATAAQGATAATAVQASTGAITVTNLPTDGSATVDTLAAAINTLTGQLAVILNS